MFTNSSPFTAWDVHYPVFSGSIYEQKHMFLPLYNHTKLCHLELDFKCRVSHFGTWGINLFFKIDDNYLNVLFRKKLVSPSLDQMPQQFKPWVIKFKVN